MDRAKVMLRNKRLGVSQYCILLSTNLIGGATKLTVGQALESRGLRANRWRSNSAWSRVKRTSLLTVISVNKGLANAQWGSARRLQVNRNEGSWRWSGAGQEERLALLDEPMVSVAERVVAQIRPVVSHAHCYSGLLSVCCSSLHV